MEKKDFRVRDAISFLEGNGIAFSNLKGSRDEFIRKNSLYVHHKGISQTSNSKV